MQCVVFAAGAVLGVFAVGAVRGCCGCSVWGYGLLAYAARTSLFSASIGRRVAVVAGLALWNVAGDRDAVLNGYSTLCVRLQRCSSLGVMYSDFVRYHRMSSSMFAKGGPCRLLGLLCNTLDCETHSCEKCNKSYHSACGSSFEYAVREANILSVEGLPLSESCVFDHGCFCEALDTITKRCEELGTAFPTPKIPPPPVELVVVVKKEVVTPSKVEHPRIRPYDDLPLAFDDEGHTLEVESKAVTQESFDLISPIKQPDDQGERKFVY